MHSIDHWQAQWLAGLSSTQTLAYDEQGSTSYASLIRQVLILAEQLKQHPQTQWILWAERSDEFLLGFLALLISQKNIILPPNQTTQQIAQLQQQGAQVFELSAWQSSAEHLSDEIIKRLHAEVNWAALAVQPCLHFYTSGSTGEAKQVPRSLRQLLFELQTLTHSFELPRPAVYIATVSHQHIYGLLFKVLLPFYQGGAFYNEQLAYPEHILAQAHRLALEYPVVLIASPAFLKRWPEGISIQPIKHIFSSGGVLPEQAHGLIDQPIVEVLGSSETGGIAYKTAPNVHWQVFADVDINIENSALSIKSRHAYQSGWIYSGDSAELHQHGFILGARLDRIVKLEEKRISLDAIEASLKQLQWISEAHVLLLSNASGRQNLACVCILTKNLQQQLKKNGKKAIVQQIKQQLVGQVERIALPRQWRFVSQLPSNSQAKLNQQEIRALFMPQHLPITRLVSQQHDQRVHLELEFSPEQIYFQGHFPDFPVYPGVAQIAMVDAFAQQYLGLSGACGQMEQIKFMRMIRPYDVLQLEIERQQDRVTFKLYGPDANVASGRLIYVSAGDQQTPQQNRDHCA